MSTPLATVKNEAASRLRDSMYDLAVTPDREAFLVDLDAALAAERRATVERIRARALATDAIWRSELPAVAKAGVAYAMSAVADILDAEAAR